MTYKTLAKICATISGSSIVYMFFISYEGTNLGWIIFIIFLAFAILFGILNEQGEEIEMLHSPKESKLEKERHQKAHSKELAETDPRNYDPFYISDKFNPNYQKLMEEKKLEEKVSHKIPEGLYKCEQCGKYKGEVIEKDLTWNSSFNKAEENEKYLTVSCLCDGILCHKCKKNKIHRPTSNSYNENGNDILHHPYLTGMMSCGECREKRDSG